MSLNRSRTSLSTVFMSFSLALFVSCFQASGVAQTAAAVAPVAPRLTQPIDEKQLVTLKGTVHKLATRANDRGAVDEGLALERMQVVLKRSPAQEAALQQTLQGLHQPGSASYHKWLTPAQFGERFGPSDADIATISTWLGTHGFTVTKVNPGKQTLEFSGSAGQFNKTFRTQIHKFQINGQVHTANAIDPSIPAALAPVFSGFASLNNFPIRSALKVQGTARYNPVTHESKANWTQGEPGYFPNNFLAPGDFAVQYDLNPLYTAGTKGAGQTIGIINESNISVPLVNQYRTLFGLPTNPPNVIIDGNDPGIDGVNNPDGPNGASVEAYLDVEQSGAVAPAATIDLIIAGDTALANGLGFAAEHAVYGNVAPVLSLSFGECEAAEGASNNAFFYNLWEQAAAQGQTVMVSAGDASSAGCDDDNTQQYAVFGQQVSGLASTPWNVAVGGTDFYYSDYADSPNTQYTQLQQYWNETPSNNTPTVSLLGHLQEQPWNDSQYGFNEFNLYDNGYGTSIAGGSGGASNCATGSYPASCVGYPKPTWQTGTGVPADGVRDLPDVSLFAANGLNWSSYPICAEDGDCQPVASSGTVQVTGVGGTSASSPAFAGIMALVNEKYGPQGQADFVLYPLAKQFPSAFYDVTVGTNSVPCNIDTTSDGYTPADCIAVANPLTVTDSSLGTATEGQIGTGTTAEYNAGVGYDLASGLGTIDANNLVTNWGSVKFTSSSVTLGSSQATFAHGTTVTISGAVTPGTATGAVSLESTSTEPLNAAIAAFTLVNGAYTANVNYLPGGTYEIYGLYSGDGTYGASTSSKTSITVTPENSVTSLQALNAAGAATTSGTLPYGTQLLLEASPTGTVSKGNANPATGTITYLNGSAAIGSSAVSVIGYSELNFVPSPSATPYTITASYSGDASYNASTSAPLSLTIGKDTPNLFLDSGTESQSGLNLTGNTTSLTVGLENSAEYGVGNNNGQPLTNPAIAPTGVVTLTGLPSGTLTFPALAAVVDQYDQQKEGVATLPLPAETPGTYSVTISYPGDANYTGVTAPGTLTIAAPAGIPTTTTATATATANYSSGPTLTFSVTGTTAGGPPSGVISIFSSGVELGTIATPQGLTADTFTESISLNGSLAAGANQITVQYSGNSVYAPSFATATISNVNGSLQLVPSGGITIATPGGSGTSTITATLGGGLPATGVTLSCTVAGGTTDVPTCAVGSLTATSSSTATATLTVNTTAATTGALLLPKMPWAPVGGGVAVAGLLFLVMPAKRRRLGTLLGALVLVAVVGFSSGCSGHGSSPAKPGNPGTPGTPAGSYTVTVTGTGGGVTATTSVVVTVQ